MPGSDTAGTARKPVSIYEIQHWTDVAVEYVRTIGYDFEKGTAVAQTALVAKHAKATLNMSPFSGDDIAPIVMNPTLTITTEYDTGTFDATKATFTPASA